MSIFLKFSYYEQVGNINSAKKIKESSFLMTKLDEFVIGRGESCDVTIEDEHISDQHCNLRFENDQLIIKDLTSKNSTFVNGNAIFESFLRIGDTVQLGYCRFCIDELQTTSPHLEKLQPMYDKKAPDVNIQKN